MNGKYRYLSITVPEVSILIDTSLYWYFPSLQITFTLVLNTAENTDYLEKTSNKSCLKKFEYLGKFIPKSCEIRKNNINISPPSRLINIISSKIHSFSKNRYKNWFYWYVIKQTLLIRNCFNRFFLSSIWDMSNLLCISWQYWDMPFHF